MRFTKILCTLGPASESPEMITALAEKGMNVARVNMSHGTREEHQSRIGLLQQWNARNGRGGRPVGIIADTAGSEVRTGDTERAIAVQQNQTVLFSPHPLPDAPETVILVNHQGFAKDARSAGKILIDNGELVFDIVTCRDDGAVLARARQDGSIGSRRHVNLPGATLSLPAITERDKEDIRFAAEAGVDFIALSFIRNAEDIRFAREHLPGEPGDPWLIAKIETREATEHLSEIIQEADGVMIARGDLGAELPFEAIPALQDEIVSLCRSAGKPVIVATHMLESMIHQPQPTRAEVTDVAHAATTRTDATMLSGETSVGKHPLLALDAMDRVLRTTEKRIARFRPHEDVPVHDERQARAEAAFTLAESSEAAAIIAFTKTGQTARDLSMFRPMIPILAFTPTEALQRKLQLLYGVWPFVMELTKDPEHSIVRALAEAKRVSGLESGARVVIVSDTRAGEALVNTVQMRTIP